MKKPSHLLAILAIVATLLTIPFFSTDSNAIQVETSRESHTTIAAHNGNLVSNSMPSPMHDSQIGSSRPPHLNFSTPSHQPTVQMNWERIQTNGIGGVSMYRTPVPGGWLITSQAGNQKAGTQLVFVPDVVHGWGPLPNFQPNPYQPYPSPRTSYVSPSSPNTNPPQQYYSPHPYAQPQNFPSPNNRTPNSPSPKSSPFNNAMPRYDQPNEPRPNDFNPAQPPQSNQNPSRHRTLSDRQMSPNDSPESLNRKSTEVDPAKSRNSRTKAPVYHSPKKWTPKNDSFDNRIEEPVVRAGNPPPTHLGNNRNGSVDPQLKQPTLREPYTQNYSNRGIKDAPRRHNHSADLSEGSPRIRSNSQDRTEETLIDSRTSEKPIPSRTDHRDEPSGSPAPLQVESVQHGRILILQEDGKFKTSEHGITLRNGAALIDGFILIPNKTSPNKVEKNNQANSATATKPKFSNPEPKSESKKTTSVSKLSKKEIDVDPPFENSNEPAKTESQDLETNKK